MSFADTQQLVAVLRHTLLQNAEVKAIVGGRVLGAHPRTPDERTVVYPMVITELDGGSVSPTSTFQAQTMYLYAYSRGSQGEAHRLYDACFAALQHNLLRRDGVTVAGYAMESQRPESGWNEQARAYWSQGLWTLRASYRSSS